MDYESIHESLSSRRALLRTAGIGITAGAASFALPKSLLVGKVDSVVLNFALNLEYLEAEFYTYATTGRGIEDFGIRTDGSGDQGQTTGGSKIDFGSAIIEKTAMELAEDERQHVKFLREALGPDAVAKPSINLNAMGMGFGNVNEFLMLARAFEDTGVSAYNGAAPLISDKGILGAAAQILAAESYHAGNIRLLVDLHSLQTMALDKKDVLPPPTGDKYFCVDSKALGIARLPPEVLKIVKPFFPNGLNGTIK